VLRVEHLRIGNLPALTFEVADGECLAVEGPSGSGKTLLLRAIADLDAAPGQVFLDGHERMEMPATAWRKAVRFAAAEPGWWGDTPRTSFPEAQEKNGRVERILSGVGLDAEILDRQIATLSTGERLRIALVRALADEPRVLLLDEPTSALDAANAALVEELIRFQILAGRNVLIASHDAGLVSRLAHARLQLAQPGPARMPEREAS
jgi:ABC-type iron transport system FetAB ATPase subunit